MRSKARIFLSLLFALGFSALLTSAPALAEEADASLEQPETQAVQSEEVAPAASQSDSVLFALDPLQELLASAPAIDATANLNGCFPPSPPPTSCECGSCCECNKCWSNGVLRKVPCNDP